MKSPQVNASVSTRVMSNVKPWALGLLTASLLVAAGCSSSGFKPEEHKPAKLQKIPAPTQTLTQVWRDSIGAEAKYDPLRPQLDILNDKVYAAARDGRVYAWDLHDKSIWETKTKQNITSGVIAADGLVVVGTGKGDIIALGADDGKVRWKHNTGASILAPAAISGGRVVVLGNDGTVTAVDQNTGEQVWTYDIPMPPLSVRGSSSPVIFDDNTVIVAGASGRIYGLDLATGVPKWERRVAVSSGTSEVQRLIDIDGDPLVSGRQLFAVSYQGQLTSVNIDSQQVGWIFDVSSLKSLAEGLGNIYTTTSDGKVIAVDERSGKKVWEMNDLAYRGLSNPVILGRYLVVGDAQGYIHLIDQTEGKIVGRVDVSGAVTELRVVNDRLLVNTDKGRLSIWQVPQS